MEFRFLPRQMGLFGKRLRGGSRGKAVQYEPKNLVTSEEVNSMKHSKVTPYLHKNSELEAAPEQIHESHRNGIQEQVSIHTAHEAERNREIYGSLTNAAVEVEGKTPAQYMHEPKQGLMGKIQNIFDRKNAPSIGKEQMDGVRALGTDADGKILFKDDIIGMIQEELQRRRTERLPLELQWQLNGNFYDGNQYCDINPACNEIMQYPRCYDWEQHEVYNRIAPLIETRVANLKKINYAMIVKPATNEMDDYQKAKVSTAILRHTQQISGFNTKKDALILWNELCGSCFWLSWWDSTKGNVYATVNDLYEDENGQIAKRERHIYEGDVDYGLLTPYEVYPESIFKQTVADQRSIIVEQVKTVDEIENLYGIRVEGTEVESFTLVPTPAAGGLGYEATVLSMGKANIKNCQRVVTYFERKSKAYPRGRMAILIGDTELVYYGVMPYDEIPIIRTVCKEKAGQFFGKSVIEELIPLQRAYNTACNDIAEYLKRLKSPQHKVLEGSVDMDQYEEHANEPGSILVYRNPDAPPITDQSVHFSGEVFTQKYDLERQMEYVAAVSQLMVYGETPNGVTSGTAIDSLRDIDNTRLALTGDYIRNAVLELAKLWLSMYKRFASTYRVIQYTGTNEIGNALVWSKEDITSYDIEFSTENELMFSEQGQWQRVMQVLSSGIADQNLYEEVVEKIRDFIKSGTYNSELSANELQAQAAVRENALLTENILPQIREYDDHQIHAEEHLRYILQMEFELLKKDKPALAQVMISHYMEHVSILQQNMQAQGGEGM